MPPFFGLDLVLSRLPRAVLPWQKGSGADHADLVRGSEPLPAGGLPRDQLPDPAGGRRPHGGVVQVWEDREEDAGLKAETLTSGRQTILLGTWTLMPASDGLGEKHENPIWNCVVYLELYQGFLSGFT